MSEARLWQRMRNGLVSSCFLQRIENITGDGVPDVALHCRETGICVWIELKYRAQLPVRKTTPIFKGDYGLRPEQKAWIYERSMAGALIWILAQCDQQLWLVHGKHARELEGMDLRALNSSSAWSFKARTTDWSGLKRHLILERGESS